MTGNVSLQRDIDLLGEWLRRRKKEEIGGFLQILAGDECSKTGQNRPKSDIKSNKMSQKTAVFEAESAQKAGKGRKKRHFLYTVSFFLVCSQAACMAG